MAREQKRLTRKELKEDPLMTALSEAQQWFDLHGTKLIIGAIIVAVAIFGSIFYGRIRASAEQEGAASLMDVGTKAQDQSTQTLVAPLMEVADNYKGTQAGADAVFALAQLAIQENDWEKALDYFERFENEYGDLYLSGSAALMGHATTLENLGRRDEAAVLYDKVASRKDAHFASEFALLSAARCWAMSGDTAAARDRNNRVIAMKLASEEAQTRAKLNLAVLDAAQ
ncbi:MAG: tetratricopeptide repeat protein [bacterium]